MDIVKPVFDSRDGSFWMCFDDFITHYVSTNVCIIRPWEEIRLKGKFIRVREISEPDNSWVISKFYYTFQIKVPAKVIIGVHQEDNRTTGADNKRQNLDLSFAILRKTKGKIELWGYVDNATEREIQQEFDLIAGSYILVPRTTGALLSASTKEKKELNLYETDPSGRKVPHLEYAATIDDIFRKVDLVLNRELSAEELNQFGLITDLDYFKQIKAEDFKKGSKFADVSSTDDGLT